MTRCLAVQWLLGQPRHYGVSGTSGRRPPAVAAPRPALPSIAGQPVRQSRRRAWLASCPPACTALVTLVVTLWKIQVPSFWRDEGATQSATQRSFPELIAMLGHVDAVHGAYYVLMWLEVRLAGHSELALRLPSALAMAAAAALITVTGRRLVSRRAGAGRRAHLRGATRRQLVRPGRPSVRDRDRGRRGGQLLPGPAGRGRQPAALGVLVRGQPGGPRAGQRIGLLLIPAHAATLAAWRGQRHRRALARRWPLAVAAAWVALLPLLAAAWAQRAQVGWLRPPGLAAALATGRWSARPG